MSHIKPRHIDIAFSVAFGSLAGLAIFVSAYGVEQVGVMLASIALGLVCLVLTPFFILWRRFTERSASPAWASAMLSLLCIATVAWSHWPLGITYRLSRASLDDLALKLRAGETVSVPTVAGLFTIQEVGLGRDGIPYLWTEPGRGGSTGFVQTSPDHVPFNLWSMIRLDDRWQYISED